MTQRPVPEELAAKELQEGDKIRDELA